MKKIKKIVVIMLLLIIGVQQVVFGIAIQEEDIITTVIAKDGEKNYDYNSEIANFDPEGNSTCEEKIVKLEEIFKTWCKENDIKVVSNTTGVGGEFYKGDNIIDVSDMFDSIKDSLNSQNAHKFEALKESSGILRPMSNLLPFRDSLLKEIATQQNIPVQTDPNNNQYVDPMKQEANPPETGEDIWDIVASAIDGLAGILLYPAKLLVVGLASVCNLIVKGIAEIGGNIETDSVLISVEDIIYTTSTNKGVPIVAIDFSEERRRYNKTN